MNFFKHTTIFINQTNIKSTHPRTDQPTTTTRPYKMEEFNRIFTHKPEFKIIICKACRHAVVPQQIQRHLKDNHPRVQPNKRREIANHTNGMTDVALEHEQVEYPPSNQAPVTELPIHQDGFQCIHINMDGVICGHVCKGLTNIRRHYRQSHAWQVRRKSGRKGRNDNSKGEEQGLWEEGVTYQRFFEYAKWMKNFRVEDPTEIRARNEGGSLIERVKKGERFLKEMEKEKEEKEKRRKIQFDGNRYEANPWLDHTRWDEHLGGFVKEDIMATIEPSTEEEEAAEKGNIQQKEKEKEKRTETGTRQSRDSVVEEGNDQESDEEEGEGDIDDGLMLACQSTSRVIRKALSTCQQSNINRSVLEYINRRETGEKDNERPFYARHKVKTVKKYRTVWVKMMRFIWRTTEWEEDKRPKYALTEMQKNGLEVIKAKARERNEKMTKKEKKEKMEELDERCTNFWITMLDHELKDDWHENAMFSALAVMGLDTQNKAWMPAINYTTTLSAVVTVARALVVYKAYTFNQKKVKQLMEEGLDEKDAKAAVPSVFEVVQKMVHRFMTLTTFGGRPTPMDRILRMRTYGMKIRFTTKAEGRVCWNGEEILIDKISFTMDNIRTVVHGLEDKARSRLIEELMLIDMERKGEEIPKLELSELVDNPAELTEGWSFVNDIRNKWSTDGNVWMWRRLFGEEMWRKFARDDCDLDEVDDKADIRWDEKKVERYMRQVTRFKEELFALVHLTAGAPARGTEVLSIKAENGAESRAQRGVFIDEGMVAFVTSYHKGYSTSQMVKVIHRYVPKEVGELVVYYLWLVVPFVRHLQMAARGESDFSSFIWEPEPEEEWYEEDDWDGEDDRNKEDEEDGDEEDGGDGEEDEDGGGEEDEDGEQGRRRRENKKKERKEKECGNVDGYWNTDRVRRVVVREIHDRIQVKITTAIWRQVYPAIQREWAKGDEEVCRALDGIYHNGRGAPEGAATDAEVRAQQAGHGTRMEEMIYGLLLSESPSWTVSERQRFRKVSMDWHRFLRFKSAWEDGRVDGKTKKRMEDERMREEMERWQQVRKTDLTKELKKMVGDKAEFRSVQEAGLRAIVDRQPRVLIVMRTGGGKSLFFMIPAKVSKGGVSIVVVPLNSLREDLKVRCDRAGIKCAEWKGDRPAYWASIILVTPESAVTKAFHRFMDEKKMMRQLDRVVIDECHVVLDSTENWRPDILKLIEMTGKGTQLVYLTATLAPKDEVDFYDAMGLDEKEVVKFRDRTTRTSICYRVMEYDVEEEDGEVKKLVEKMKKKYAKPGQIIVYCARIEQAKRLAKVLDCSTYYRAVGSDEEKREILMRFTKGLEQVFTATNALGLGIDAPQIRAVIHVGMRKKMRDYAQESGRAARDGKDSDAIIMRGYWIGRDGKKKLERGWGTEAAMMEFIEGNKCRRIVMDREMDGEVGRLGCRSGERRCDVCKGEPRGEKRRRVMVNNGEGREIGGDGGSEDVEEDVRGEDVRGEDVRGEDIRGEDEDENEEEREWERIVEERKKAEEEGLRAEAAQAEADYEEEMERQEIIRQSGLENQMGQRIDEEVMQRKLEGWCDVCVICKAQGRKAIGHKGWQDCRVDEEERRVFEMAREFVGGLEMEAFSGCMFCKAPQSVCQSWQKGHAYNTNGFRRRRGGCCQFEGVVEDAGAALLGFRMISGLNEWMTEEVENEMRVRRKKGRGRDLGWVERMKGEEIGDMGWLKGWCERKLGDCSIEMSGLCQFIYVVG